MKTFSIFLALLNSVIAGLLLAASLTGAEMHGAALLWLLTKLAAGSVVILIGALTWMAGMRALLHGNALALQPQNGRETLDVRLREQPVAAARAAGLEQPLILEVPDLRDRDVGVFVAEALADGADRMQARGRARVGEGRHRRRNVIRYFPI